MKNILIISRFVPYDNAPHAGGKVHNYNVKKLNSESKYNIRLLSFCKEAELSKIDHKDSNLKSDIINLDLQSYTLSSKIMKRYYRYNVFSRNGCMREGYILASIEKYLDGYKKEGFIPDVIILEWTQIVIYCKYIKAAFPNAKIISIEHDVTFQAYERQKKMKKSTLKRNLFSIRSHMLKKVELDALKRSDIIITLNEKDKQLLKENGIETKIESIVPYYDNLSDCKIDYEQKNLIFYGKMDRPENYLSCIWFIDNVFNKLITKFTDLKFYIVGYNPPKQLLDKANKNVIVTGFVENPKEYFRKASILVAPLLLGAGIKIKILEAMSAGLAVVTNDIGIEGIPAKDGIHYLKCTNCDEYYEAISKSIENKIDINIISTNAKSMLEESFNIESGYERFKHVIDSPI